MIRKTLIQVVKWVRNFVIEKLRSNNEDLPYYLTILFSAIIFIVALTGFIELTDELTDNELGPIDKSVSEYVMSLRNETLTDYFTVATHLGDRYAYLAITIVLAVFFFFKNRSWKFILQTTSVLILASITNVVLKRAINRARPTLEHLVTVNTLSYPSGHSMSAMAFYGFLIFLCVRHRMHPWLRYLLIALLAILILSIGVSRIYLGVHFPSDVAAGFIGGLIWVTFCAVLFSLFELLRKSRNPVRHSDGD